WAPAVILGVLLACVFETHYIQAPAAFLLPAVLFVLRPWRTVPGEREEHGGTHTYARFAVAFAIFLVFAASTLAWLGADRDNHALMSSAKAEAGQTLLIEQSPFMFVNRNGWLSRWLEEHRPPRLLFDVD